MSTTVLKNGLVFTPDGSFEPLDIAFSEGIITEVSASLPGGGETVDCSGCYVLPGLTDVHLHGCAGADFGSGTEEAFDRICRYEYSRGVTAVCPTLMTMPDEALTSLLGRLSRYASEKRPGCAEVIGIHAEGPFISPKKCGAQSKEHIQEPSADRLGHWIEASDGLLRVMTAAPEIGGVTELIGQFSGRLHFSLGHTACTYAEAMAAFEAGADHLTHLFNAMPPFHHRETGAIGAALDTPSCFAELICDGVHVSPAAVRAAFAMFGSRRIVLISDSMEAAGMPDGEYSLGGQRVVKQGSRAVLADGTLAGSVSTLYDCMIQAVRMGIPLADAVRAAAENPCRSVGCFDRTGSTEPGKTAHFLILGQDDIGIRKVI